MGAHKCGTTALFDYIWQHPLAYCPAEKEPTYFALDIPEIRGYTNYGEYLALFAAASDEQTAIGEASPGYFLSRVAAAELFKHYPQARIIIMIRNPVDMVYSFHSQMQITLNEDVLDFEKAWRLQDARLAGRNIPAQCRVPEFLQYRNIGRLSQYARAFLALFPVEQVHFVVFDDLKNDPRKTYDDVCSFLGLPHIENVDFRIVNANRKHVSKLVARISERPVSPMIKRLAAAAKRMTGLQQVGIRQALSQRNTRNVKRKPLAPAFRRELVEEFRAEVAELEKLTGRNLQHWLL